MKREVTFGRAKGDIAPSHLAILAKHAQYKPMETKTETELSGKILIAMPGMGDPRFEKAVVYMCAHSEDGAMGLIINKPAREIGFSELLEQLSITPSRPIDNVPVHLGGPVEHGRGFVLHSREYIAQDATLEVSDDVGMTASLEILEDISKGVGPNQCLLALGYSGWGPGQLEDEVQSNSWLISDAPDDLIFASDNAHKWEQALDLLGIDPRMLSNTGGRA